MLLRSVLIGAVGFLAVVTAAAASETTRDAYASLTTSNAAACARACADDGICMAWSFHAENQCQLSAVVSAEPMQALASGFSSRAPASLRPSAPTVYAEVAPPAAAPQPATQTPVNEEPVSAEAAEDEVLLGGPDEGDLRLGLR